MKVQIRHTLKDFCTIICYYTIFEGNITHKILVIFNPKNFN